MLRLRREAAVFEHTEAGEDGVALVTTAQARTRTTRLRPVRHVLSQQLNLTRGGGELAREQVDERGFSSAIGANHPMHLTALEGDRDVVDGHQTTPATAEVDALQKDVACHACSSNVSTVALLLLRPERRSRNCAGSATKPCGMKATHAMMAKPKLKCQCLA